MPTNDYNIDFFRLQDKSLCIEKLTEEIIKGVKCLVAYVKRNKTDSFCIECGSGNIVVNSYYIRTIRYLDIAGYNSIIKYKQRRYQCRDCKKTFNESTNLVEKYSTISNQTKLKLLEECRIKQSFTDVSERLNVSTTTVLNEFKASTIAGEYALIIGNPISGKILDVLPSRQQEYLYDYFNKVSDEERFSVKYIVTDLFEPFRTIVRNRFWKSIHIADRFHWVRLATDAYNRMRIKIMNNYKDLGDGQFKGRYNKYSTYYYMLKKYAKVLVMNRYSRSESFFESKQYVYYLDKELTLNEIIEYILNYDKDMEEGYFLLQDLYKISKQSTFETARHDLKEWISKVEEYDSTLKYFKSVATTYRSWLK